MCVCTRTHTHTHTSVSLSLTHTHTHTYACTHTHTHTHTLEAGWRQLEVLGARDREKVSLELWLKERQSLSMSHREREIVPDGRTIGRKSTLSLNFFPSVWNAKNAMISRGAESVWRDVQFKVRKVWRNSASDYAVADSINLVFCSVLLYNMYPHSCFFLCVCVFVFFSQSF